MEQFQKIISMLPFAIGIGLAVVVIFAVASKFKDKNALAKSVFDTLKSDHQPVTKRMRIFIFVACVLMVLLPLAYKFLLSDAQKASFVSTLQSR